MQITEKQSRFISEYLVCSNATEAARRAGYRAKSARQMAAENLSKPAVLNELRRRQAEMAVEFDIKRDDVVRGLLEAIAMGREQLQPQVMISGLTQLAKLLGFYAPEVHAMTLGPDALNIQRRFSEMSDAQLLEIIAARE